LGVNIGVPLHSSIITSNGQGFLRNFRGEPSKSYGQSYLSAAPFAHNPIADPDWDHDAKVVVIATGSLAESTLQCVENQMKAIDRANLIYHAYSGPNSNTAVATTLQNCGIPAGDTFGYLPGFTPLP
jgi:hypothetical protein